MREQRPCYIFDIDGTIADNSHRTHHLQQQPKDWESYHRDVEADGVYQHILGVARKLGEDTAIVFCTGRHEAQRKVTEDFLYRHGFLAFEIYMRAENDFRPDHVIKLELLQMIHNDGFKPIMAFDDRNSVVKMWRDAGIPCAQVADGDF